MDDEAVTTVATDPWQVLYVDRYQAMVRVAYLITGDHSVAEDLVQDAFVKIRAHIGVLDHPEAYLRTAVVNTCRGWIRHQIVVRRHEATVGAMSWQPVLEPDLGHMWSAIRRLPERQRVAVVLRFYEDLPFDRIAEALGCETATARSLVHRGLHTLRELVER